MRTSSAVIESCIAGELRAEHDSPARSRDGADDQNRQPSASTVRRRPSMPGFARRRSPRRPFDRNDHHDPVRRQATALRRRGRFERDEPQAVDRRQHGHVRAVVDRKCTATFARSRVDSSCVERRTSNINGSR
jgi:hypothetical protein